VQDLIPSAPETGLGSKKRWLALAGASLAVFMAALDTNVVNVALPIMASAFHVSVQIRWVVLAYILPTTAFLGAFGALSDTLGRKLIMLAGSVIFVAGSVLCGLSSSLAQIAVFRVIQGIGGACIGSAIMAIATVNFSPKERGRAMATVALIVPLGAVAGPSVGGLIIGALGWPTIFFINVPVGLVAFALIARYLPEDERRRSVGFDAPGAGLFTVALVLLILGLSPHGGRLTVLELIPLAGSVAVATGFVLLERRAKNPLVPMSLVRRVRFSAPLLGIMTAGIVGTGIGFTVPFFFENTLGLGPAQTGLALLFFPLGIAAASQIGGRMVDRLQPWIPSAIGSAIALLGVTLLVQLNPHWGFWEVAARLGVGGFGIGMFLPASGVAVMSAAPREHIGVAGALTNTFRYLGFALGPTLAVAIWNPGTGGEAGLYAMRIVMIVLAGVQLVTLATVLGYGVRRGLSDSDLTEEQRRVSGLEAM
jgi:EmrB/QacA subfamily drug resistance transporter